MRKLHRIYWTQGQFLTPQHFQQQDLYHTEMLRSFWSFVKPHNWGVIEIDIREDGLEAKTLEVADCTVITRDGIFMRCGSACQTPNAKIATRKFDDYLPADGSVMGVYLALAKRDGVSDTIGSGTASVDGTARYSLFERTTNDLFDSKLPESEVTYLAYAPRLLFDYEPSFQSLISQFDAVRIAEIRAAEGGAQLVTDYIPPTLTVRGSPFLRSRISDVRDLVTLRIGDFQELKRDRGLRSTAHTPQEVLRGQILQLLNRYFVELSDVVELTDVHPTSAYAMLRRLVAELSTFSELFTASGRSTTDPSKSDLIPYDHERLRSCFAEVFDRVKILLQQLSAGTEAGIPLHFDGEYFSADLDNEFFEGRFSRYYLVISSALQSREIWNEFQRSGKVSSRGEIGRLRQSALPGLALELQAIPPEELPQRSGRYTFFMVDTADETWKVIADDNSIAVYCDLSPDQLVIRIVKIEAS